MSKLNSSGYTLIELLLTLSLLSILISLPLISLPKLNEPTQYEADLIAKQIHEQFLAAQQVAMSTGKRIYIRTDNDRKLFLIRYHALEDYMVIPYQFDNMYFETITLFPNDVSYLANGHPSRSGSFFLVIGQYRYRFTIYLGKGMISYKRL
ncbi:prepilin-type N-terminal cleavage/methylation domain-containing protein [Halalkalibacter krulwichiae]|uniref:Uncharacterized protein n=1 Tax=Halalkalibacter krulwichiae TaxID=199441 RepID=A0A1X9ML21_9BACI|nr:prepilin-type N-terminal cleavage/methylation domain-containing protein [Halalkalibacter krulwichiae]ARK31432.1 hypothetical protein BkAM31D_17090 [Halalkalibacter krulwichiae]